MTNTPQSPDDLLVDGADLPTAEAPGQQATPLAPNAVATPTARTRRPNASLVHGLLTNPKATTGAVIVLLFILLALFAPVIAPGDPSRITDASSLPPSGEHLLGTTARGQDVLALTLHGARSSLLVGFVVGICATLVGMAAGLASAYFGRLTDEVISLVTNIFLLVPSLPLLVILAAFLPPGLGTIMLVLVLTGWAGAARVLRSQAMSIKNKDFVAAATLAGESPLRIMFREILPNMASIAMGSLLGGVIGAIGAQAGLEFLGLGDISRISWGTNLYWAGNEGALMTGSWWVFVPSGACIALVAFALALINYAVDEVTNPRLRKVKAPKHTTTSTRRSGASVVTGSTAKEAAL
ncbi:MAG TPA: ABC transporter permease [Candidatus Luteococcus avicola]|nr:ABC transporter permease [Candidatus Luteococcus avicola]